MTHLPPGLRPGGKTFSPPSKTSWLDRFPELGGGGGGVIFVFEAYLSLKLRGPPRRRRSKKENPAKNEKSTSDKDFSVRAKPSGLEG